MLNKELDLNVLFKELTYLPLEGIFIWNYSRQGITKGTRAGGTKADGSRSIMINRVEYYEHRLAWLYINKEWPKTIIDHIDRDNSNNRISNLRESTTQENGRNRKDNSIYGHNISKRYAKYGIEIQHNKKQYRYKVSADLEFTIKVRDWLINLSKTNSTLPIDIKYIMELVEKGAQCQE